MNWISEWALPKIKTLFGAPREVPENLWHKCPACEQMIFHRDLERNLHVCTHCGHHMRVGARTRMDYTLDEGWQRIELPKAPQDPLRFRDQRRYVERLKSPAEGLLPSAELDPAALATVAELRRRFLPEVVDGVDVLDRPLDASSGLLVP